MGTRSLTIIEDEDGKGICCIYQQFDGYPSGVGQTLHDLLKDMRIVNGFDSTKDRMGEAANGMKCLAAQIVAALKNCIGNVYLYPPGCRDCDEEYRYIIKPGAKLTDKTSDKAWPRIYHNVLLKVESGYGASWETIYDGPAKDFDPEMKEKKTA